MRRYLYFLFLLVPLSAQANLPEVIKVHTDAIEQFMVAHPDLGTTLKTNPQARSELFTHHRKINRLMLDVVTQNDARQQIFLWYRKHINQYPNYFKHSEINYNQYPYLPQLRFQIWTNLYESRIDDANNIKLVAGNRARKRIANALGLPKQNPLRAILIKHRRLFVENDRTTLAQRKNVFRLLSLIPRDLIKAESIRIRDHIGMQVYTPVLS